MPVSLSFVLSYPKIKVLFFFPTYSCFFFIKFHLMFRLLLIVVLGMNISGFSYKIVGSRKLLNISKYYNGCTILGSSFDNISEIGNKIVENSEYFAKCGRNMFT